MTLIQVPGYRCYRCEHEWVPRRTTPPKVCPKCKSPYWDRPRRKDVAAAEQSKPAGSK